MVRQPLRGGKRQKMKNKEKVTDDDFLLRLSENRTKYEKGKNLKPPISALINEISRLFMITVRQNGGEYTAKFSRSFILKYLAHEDGVTQNSIVKFSHLRAPTVSAELALMESEGLVYREKNESDARQTLVYLTPKGRKTDDNIRACFERTEKIMLGNITDDEKEKIFSYLVMLRDNILNFAVKEEKDGL